MRCVIFIHIYFQWGSKIKFLHTKLSKNEFRQMNFDNRRHLFPSLYIFEQQYMMSSKTSKGQLLMDFQTKLYFRLSLDFAPTSLAFVELQTSLRIQIENWLHKLQFGHPSIQEIVGLVSLSILDVSYCYLSRQFIRRSLYMIRIS